MSGSQREEMVYEKYTRDKHWAERPIRKGKLKDVSVETINKPNRTIYKFTYKLV